ncbi:MAG TPA: PrsW family glutamic-type intramembrane protease [Planctomycetota bacterium]|nr:PrsW family glutamic-type intramembrane protease [Planctomycetota bacterium]
MSTVLAITLATAPCLFWLGAVLRHNDNEREPWSLVVLGLGLGATCTLGVLWLRPPLENALAPASPFVEAFVVTAFAEEMWKLLALLPLLMLSEVDEPLDGAVYGAAVGLGFAGCENVFFVFDDGDAMLALQRAFTSTLLHAACTGCLGLAWAEGKLRRFGVGTLVWLASGVAIAVGLHGLYDLYLSGDRAQALVSLLGVLPTALVLLSVKMRWARSRSEQFHPRK